MPVIKKSHQLPRRLNMDTSMMIQSPQSTVTEWGAYEEETEEAEKAVGKKTGEKLATEEEEDLDATGEASADAAAGGETAVAIPVLDIIGLAVGAGLALKAAFNKPKQLAPVDNINASYQIGI